MVVISSNPMLWKLGQERTINTIIIVIISILGMLLASSFTLLTVPNLRAWQSSYLLLEVLDLLLEICFIVIIKFHDNFIHVCPFLLFLVNLLYTWTNALSEASTGCYTMTMASESLTYGVDALLYVSCSSTSSIFTPAE